MARSLWLADVLADAYRGVSGVRFEVYPGWETRGRDGVRHIGVMNHHTGPGGYDALLRYMAVNSSISPLCNVASSHDGSRVTLVAAGKANHAGRGHLDWTGTDRGNWYTIGWEAQNDGAQPWPDKHLETVAIGNAALRNHMAVDLSRLVDHKTYAPGRKVDRHTIQLDAWRRRVATIGKDEDMALDKGDTGRRVTALQARLTWWRSEKLEWSGRYDAATVAAVKRFQEWAGLDADGRWTEIETLLLLANAIDNGHVGSGGGGDHPHPFAPATHYHDFATTTKGATGQARS